MEGALEFAVIVLGRGEGLGSLETILDVDRVVDISVAGVDVVSGVELVRVVSEDDVGTGDVDENVVGGNAEELVGIITADIAPVPVVGSVLDTSTMPEDVGCDKVVLSFAVVFPLNT